MSMQSRDYHRRHENVRRVYGPASGYQCSNCTNVAQEWAQIHRTSGEDPSDYDPMCCSCHQLYDDHWNEETKAKVSTSVKKTWDDNPARKQFSEEHRKNMRIAWLRRKARSLGGDAQCL